MLIHDNCPVLSASSICVPADCTLGNFNLYVDPPECAGPSSVMLCVPAASSQNNFNLPALVPSPLIDTPPSACVSKAFTDTVFAISAVTSLPKATLLIALATAASPSAIVPADEASASVVVKSAPDCIESKPAPAIKPESP